MVIPTTGSVVLVKFPFSDLSRSKTRPAVILADANRNDWVLCQITSKSYSDTTAIPITKKDFLTGSLRVTSYARPSKLFTANRYLMSSEIGILKNGPFKQIIDGVINLLQKSVIP